MKETSTYQKKELILGQTYTNKWGERFRVLERYHDDYYHVIYTETGNQQYIHARREKTANDNSKPYINGVGYVFTPEKPIDHFVGMGKFFFQVWQNMLARCHKKRPKFKSWEGVTICEEWYNFANFYQWASEQPFVSGERWSLDKDLFSPSDNKQYSPETCCLIPYQINSALIGLTYDEIHTPVSSPKMERRCSHLSALLLRFEVNLHQRVLDCLWNICEANGFNRKQATLASELEKLRTEHDRLSMSYDWLKKQTEEAAEKAKADNLAASEMLKQLPLVPVKGYIDYCGKIYRIETAKDLNAVLNYIKTSVSNAKRPA